MSPTLPLRQRLRRLALLISLLLFPVTMNYLSPYVILDGARQGIINGSLLVFAGLFVSSLFFGRLFCAWVCPAGGFGEVCTLVNNRPAPIRRLDWIKWLIWGIWLALIVYLAVSAGGYTRVNFTLDTVDGISVAGDADRPALFAYFIYYIVLGTFMTLSLTLGRRAGCHTICWMSPFMILGRKLRNLAAWPALRLVAEPAACSDCKTCTRGCPMSLDVNAMVKAGQMEHSECILCGMCADNCSKSAIRYSFSAGK